MALSSTSYSYDRNLTAFGSNTLNYDESNKWVSGTVNGSSVAFGYDGFGRRSSRTVGTDRIDYWYDVTGLTLQTGATNATFLRDQSGSVRSITSGGVTHNYGKDRLGSVTAMVATDGTVARTYSYDPWGETIGITGTAYNPFLFTGTYKDGATGLYQMGARYYQPGSGRFTQQDPLPDSILSFNRYAYAGCNPTNAIDPTGLACWDATAAVAWDFWSFVQPRAVTLLLSNIPGPTLFVSRLPQAFFLVTGLAEAWITGQVDRVQLISDVPSVILGTHLGRVGDAISLVYSFGSWINECSS